MDQPTTPMSEPVPSPIPAPTKSNRKKIIIGMFVAVVVLAGGYVALAKYRSLWPFPATIDISDWKTYTNQELGYSFQYPQNWEISGPDPIDELRAVTVAPMGSTEFGYPAFGIDNRTPDKVRADNANSATSTTTLGGQAATKYTNSFASDIDVQIGTSMFFVESIHLDDPIVQRILSTLTFTTPSPTAGWKTYTNTQYGVIITYPASWSVQNRYGSKGNPGVFGGFLNKDEIVVELYKPGPATIADYEGINFSVQPTKLTTVQQLLDQTRAQISQYPNPGTTTARIITIQNGIDAVATYITPTDACPIDVETVHNGFFFSLNYFYPCGPTIDQSSPIVQTAHSFRFAK